MKSEKEIALSEARHFSVFLVEDEALIRMMMVEMVELGHTVIAEAANIQEASAPFPHGSVRCGPARMPNDPGSRRRCRVCRTAGRQGSPSLHGRSAAPNGSQRHIPRPASGSSAPDRSMGDPSMNNEAQARCEAGKDRAQYRSSATNDLQEPRCQDETRRPWSLFRRRH